MREAFKILVTVIGVTAVLWWLPPEYAKGLAARRTLADFQAGGRRALPDLVGGAQ